MRFIHISDLHFHRGQENNREANTMLKTIKERYPNHKLIVTGDITDDGHPRQYENAFKALEPFKDSVFVAPGNHDFGAAGNFYSKERAHRFDEILSGPLEQGGTFKGDNTPVVNFLEDRNDRVMLIGLDSNLETDHPFDFACGEIGEEQLFVLERILNDPTVAQIPKLLYFHHHPFMHNNPFMMLKDAMALARTIFAKVDVVLFGHKHVANIWPNWGGTKYYVASDNSPGKDWAREIMIEGGQIEVKDVSIKPGNPKKKPKVG
jgi:3',5'-cyclic AMP phosphodiesterase CpdA